MQQKEIIVGKKQKKVNGTAEKIPFPTTGKMLADGTAIEPLRDIANPGHLRLLCWHRGKATIGAEVECKGQRYTSAPIDPTILHALTLPTGIAPCGSPRKLLAEICKVMTPYAGFPENSVSAIGRWLMSTWFPEMDTAPGLSLIGPDTTAGRQQLHLLHSLCRHPLLLTGANAAGLRALPTEWSFTLLIHQQELSAEVQGILTIARSGMGFMPKGGRLLNFHSCVATYAEFGNTCRPGVIPSLEIPVLPARQGLPVLDNAMLQKIADDFQPRLLGYRLTNFSKVLEAAFDAPDLTPSMRELARSLAACTPDDPDLQAQVPEFLRIQDKEMRSAAWLDLNTAIIEALLGFIHEAKENSLYVAEITNAAEGILKDRGEHQELEPRAIGPKLRALGLNTEERDRKGIPLLLTREVSRRVHELAHYFSVPSVQDGVKRCDLCTGKASKGGN